MPGKFPGVLPQVPSVSLRPSAFSSSHFCEAFTFGQIEDALEAFGEHKQGKLSVA